MLIFIDESGGFQATTKRPNAVSCVSALVVPEYFAGTLFRRFRRLVEGWKSGHQEVKGSTLDEKQMSAVLSLLRRFDILVLAVCVDMAQHSDEGLSAHKHDQADAFLRAITPTMPVRFKQDLEGLGARVRALPNQLWVQAATLTKLVNRVLDASTLYYVQRLPQTLGDFTWRINAKDVTITKYESLWREVVAPFSQSQSLKSPMLRMRGADYSAFARFELQLPEVPRHLKRALPDGEGPFEAIDIKALLTEDLRFVQSHRLTGLQIVDVLASAVRRACNGTLGQSGWGSIGRLMPRAERGSNAVRFLAFEDLDRNAALPYEDFVARCDRDSKRMITPG